MQTLADTAGRIIGGDGCFITLWDPATRSVQPAAASGPQRETYPLNTSTGPEHRTLTRSVIKAGRPIAVPDVFNTPYMDRVFAEPYPIKSLLGIPLQADGRDLGALLIGFNNPHEFSEDEIGWASQAAELIALAIAKAQAYADLERRVEERTEQLHQTNQRLLMATQLKDEFVANVSHELRTPVTSIKLYHHLLRVSPDRFEPYMERLERETARLEFIIEDLLRISEIDRKQAVPNLALTDLNALAGGLVTDRTALAEQRSLSLAFRPEAALPAAHIDPRLVGQALSVLLTNALNYTPPGGQVTVSTRLEQVEGQPWVALAVSDSGPGIPPDEMPRLFQRFFRGKVGRESNLSGTGLGLAIASEIVALHGGRIEAASEGIPGKGATFTIWLPLERAAEGEG